MMTVTLDIVTTAALLFVVATGLLVIFGALLKIGRACNVRHNLYPSFLGIDVAYGTVVSFSRSVSPQRPR